MSRIDVHIDALVLEGLPHLDGDAFAAALQGELARLIGERGAGGARHFDATDLAAPSAHVADAGPAALGVATALAIQRGLA